MVGPQAQLQRLYNKQYFWSIAIAQVIAAVMAGFGLFLLLIAAARKSETYAKYFGLFAVGWALISTRTFVQDVPLAHVWTEVLICGVFPAVVGCALLFLMRFVDVRHRVVDGLIWAQAVLGPIVLVLAAPAHLLRAASVIYKLLAFEFVICVIWFFVVAWRRRRFEFWLMGSALVFALVAVAFEIAVQNNLLPLPKVHVIHFVIPGLFVVIGTRLMQLFVQTLNRAEQANAELEQRVAQKSLELAQNYEQLGLLRSEQATQEERQRIAVLARQAFDEMRLSVRGLTGEPARAVNVLADWRGEIVTRLQAAGFIAHWLAEEPPPHLFLPARTHVQLTRVLREAVSNTIRHSKGSECRVQFRFVGGELGLEVHDNGRGITADATSTGGGHGLPNVERRVRNLSGRFGVEALPGQGTLLQVWVPLMTAQPDTVK